MPQNGAMGSPLDIAVLGAGVSGLAAAALLRLRGQNVTLLERFSTPQPLGSGLILHQSGLAVLGQLELDHDAIRLGAQLTRFEGKTDRGRSVYELAHDPGQFSLGIHRHSLFDLLHRKVLALGVPVVAGCPVDSIEHVADRAIVVSGTRRVANFDLVVDATGTHSAVRDRYASIRHRRTFSYGALWGVCEAGEGQPLDVLRQRFRGAKVGVGVIPIGRKPGDSRTQHIGFHWSIRNSAVEEWRRTPLANWKRAVISLWPEARFMAEQITRHDDLTWASYSDVALSRLYTGRIVFIGDAAHSISPRLGQGANMGLVDALTLANALAQSPTAPAGLRAYDRKRQGQVRFYHSASRWLSTLFQSDSVVAPLLRDFGFAHLCRVPYLRRQMLDSLAGLKTGLFGRLDATQLASV
jgi:2-polyprenyl-6-methoxyphenol hydroxylase-like FAD-dependent oxidoreductase